MMVERKSDAAEAESELGLAFFSPCATASNNIHLALGLCRRRAALVSFITIPLRYFLDTVDTGVHIRPHIALDTASVSITSFIWDVVL